jgi:hypothetical protein
MALLLRWVLVRLIVSVRKRLRGPCCTGRPAAQPGEEHLTGLGVSGQLRVIATDFGVAEGRALPTAAEDGHNRRVQVQGLRSGQIARPGTGLPQPGQ